MTVTVGELVNDVGVGVVENSPVADVLESLTVTELGDAAEDALALTVSCAVLPAVSVVAADVNDSEPVDEVEDEPDVDLLTDVSQLPTPVHRS